jgi:hypothetical protein
MNGRGGINGGGGNTCGFETEDLKDIDDFVGDKRMRGKYYEQFERNRM